MTTADSRAFTPELRAKAEELIGRYPGARSALLPLLHLVQHNDGHISDAGIAECAELLGLTKAEVNAVATFYTMFKREEMGRHLVSVCTNFSCKVRGSQEVFDHLSDKLGVGHNGTTADGAVTLEHAECLGNCEGAPVVTVDSLNYEGLDPQSAGELVDALLAGGELPPPTRGFAPPGIREVQHRLAGLGSADALTGGPATSQARADDGAGPTPESGPGGDQLTVPDAIADSRSDLAQAPEWEEARREEQPEREQDRQEAREEVREAGHEPAEVEDQSGYTAREFPTAKPDGDTPGEGDDVRASDQSVGTTYDDQVVPESGERESEVASGGESISASERSERESEIASDDDEEGENQ